MNISSIEVVLFSNIMQLVFRKPEDKVKTVLDFEYFDEKFIGRYY